MPDEQEKFVHSENVKNFTLKLATEIDVHQREVLTMLLAEEIAAFSPGQTELGFLIDRCVGREAGTSWFRRGCDNMLLLN